MKLSRTVIYFDHEFERRPRPLMYWLARLRRWWRGAVYL